MKTVHIRSAAAASVAAALALAAALHLHRAPAAEPVQAVVQRVAQAQAPQHPQAPQAVPHRQPWTAASADPFRSVSFAPPPPPAPAPVQAPAPVAAEKPVAPPFPYQFFGRMVSVDGKKLTFLIRDGSLVPVQQGEVIDGSYRIDAASDTQLMVTYLPLNEQSTLTLQSAAP
jgi:hypothetical protein